MLENSNLDNPWNIVHFHNAYSILLTKEANLDSLEYLSDIGADGLVASAKVSPADLEMELLQKCNYVFSAAIPSSILVQREGEVADYVANCLKAGTDRRFFLTTEWEAPTNTPPANIHEIMRIITQPS